MYKRFFKRFFDILVSLAALPFCVLLWLVLAPFIYFEDKGTVFYTADRVGKDGKLYKMYKLRSMKMNAEDIRNPDGSTFNSDNDPRVTKIGRFMRKTSVDELPQILNVLLGHMSFIGPRPALVTRPYEEMIPIAQKRLQVRPGITGYAQAYYRNSITVMEKYEYDSYYVDNVSFLLDVKIILQTVKSVLKRENINTTTEAPKEEASKETVETK